MSKHSLESYKTTDHLCKANSTCFLIYAKTCIILHEYTLLVCLPWSLRNTVIKCQQNALVADALRPAVECA